MPKLDAMEIKLSYKDLVLKWLIEHKISFNELSLNYVTVLEKEKENNNTEISRYSNLLAQYFDRSKLKNKDRWIEDKTVGTLYAYEKFRTAPIYRNWENMIQERNINTDKKTLDYIIYNE